MVRLSSIDEGKLKEIEKLVQSKKNIIPVTSKGENLIEEVEKKFGYRLSPTQIYKLQRGERAYKVKLPETLASRIEREYGSIEKALRSISPVNLPSGTKETHEKLLALGRIKLTEIDKRFGAEIYKDLRQLAKAGYVHREGDFIVPTRAPYNPLMKLFL